MKIRAQINPSKHLAHMYSCLSAGSRIKPPDENQVGLKFDLSDNYRCAFQLSVGSRTNPVDENQGSDRSVEALSTHVFLLKCRVLDQTA